MENSFSFLKPIADLQKLLNSAKCAGMIIGGIANNLLGNPRFTADIDVVVLLDTEKISNFLLLAQKHGIVPRIKNAANFAAENRVLLLKHEKSSIGIDVSLGMLPFEEEAIKNSTSIKYGNITLRIPAVEDFIVFKAVAHREKDLLDIKEIVSIHSKLNIAKIKKNLKEFAKVLEMPEIWTDIERMLKTKK